MTHALFPALMHLPVFLLHAWRLLDHPRMAIAGSVSTFASLGSVLATPHDVAIVFCVVHKWSLAEFLYALHTHLDDDIDTFLVVKHILQIASVVCCTTCSEVEDILLFGYALYIACQMPSVPFHLNYLFFLLVFSVIPSLHAFAYVCTFVLTASAYQKADIDVFMREPAHALA